MVAISPTINSRDEAGSGIAIVKSSIASPSLAPLRLSGTQRMKKASLGWMVVGGTIVTGENTVRFSAALPSFAPASTLFGVLKSSELMLVQVPVRREVASVLI